MFSHPRGWPSEYIPSIVEKDIIPTIIDGMSANHDSDLIEAACGAIKNLAVSDEARRPSQNTSRPLVPSFQFLIQTLRSLPANALFLH
jgi:hypothetical protein